MSTILDLPGPLFLLFYIVLAVVVVLGATAISRLLESRPIPNLGEPDPYLIAHLRGGVEEAIRVCMISLIDRGLLEVKAEKVVTAPITSVRRPLERQILNQSPEPIPAYTVVAAKDVILACAPLQTELEKHGLVPTESDMARRVAIGAVALAVLWLIGVAKLGVALERGYTNVQFLLILLGLTPIALYLLLRLKRTPSGEQLLADYQTLFSRLRARARTIQPGGETNELALLAGVFGLSAIKSGTVLPELLFPAARSGAFGASSGCGSSCGSSCGGGGGSCGGGCGGCGGH